MNFVALLEHRVEPESVSAFSALLAKDKGNDSIVAVSLPTVASGDGSYQKPIKNVFEFSASPEEANSKSSAAMKHIVTAGEFISRRLGVLGLLKASISSIGLESFDYARYYTAKNKPLRDAGYVLLMTNVLAGDLNAFGRSYSAYKMTGAEITDMAKEFDRLFCPVFSGFFAPLVALEWPANPKGVYDRRSSLPYTKGGMSGGDHNAYWGITQFGNSKKVPTYDETVNTAGRYGVFLPGKRSDMTFGQMLVAAYVLAIARQPTLVEQKIPINADTIYINHNQGNGIWKAQGRKIPAYNWSKQSAEARGILRRYGYSSA